MLPSALRAPCALVVKNLLPLVFIFPLQLLAQVTCSPAFPSVTDAVTITFDATQGNGALTGVSPVYAQMASITLSASTSLTTWEYVGHHLGNR